MQRRNWEHLIHDEADFTAHIHHLRFNPDKHGHVAQVADRPYSTFHRAVAMGVYQRDWVGSAAADAT